MTHALRLGSWYKQSFMAKSELNFSLSDYLELVPYEVDIYFSLWIIQQKKKFEKMKQLKGKK